MVSRNSPLSSSICSAKMLSRALLASSSSSESKCNFFGLEGPAALMVTVCEDSFCRVDVKMADITALLFYWPSVRAGALGNGRISFGEVKVSDIDGEVVAVCRRSVRGWFISAGNWCRSVCGICWHGFVIRKYISIHGINSSGFESRKDVCWCECFWKSALYHLWHRMNRHLFASICRIFAPHLQCMVIQ